VSNDAAITGYVKDALGRGRLSLLSEAPAESLTVETVRRAAESGDQVAGEALEAAGRMLGLGIAALVNLLNPRLVIVSGEGTRAGPLRWEAAILAMRESAFAGLDRNVDFFVDSVDDVAWARGAACVVLGELFSSPMHRNVALEPVRA
jgi:predicted NBD/HSP70 family sugar kinase